MSIRKSFSLASRSIAHFTGSAMCFAIAVVLVLVWAATGPMFGFSETWQLVINTGTTIVTFLMVFLIQNTQNTDTAAIHVKLDELIRALEPANNRMLALEELDEETLEDLRQQFDKLARKAREAEPCEADEKLEIKIKIDDDLDVEDVDISRGKE